MTSTEWPWVCEGMPSLRDLQLGLYRLIVNPVIAVSGLRAEVHALERVTVGRVAAQYTFRPVRFVPNAKLTRLDKLAVAFDALALSHLTGDPPLIAKIIHGPDYTTTAVHLPKLMDEAQLLVAELTAQQASGAPPPVILNKHCPECEFQSRCRQVATEQEDLSLIRTISAKERAKLNARGIFTVTQLSYTYRPRRRPVRHSGLTLRHEPALKALAIRKQRVHVVGTPCFTIPANAVYLDVEGVPDQNFYYLIGLRYQRAGRDVHEAFWADDPQDEREMWAACLRALTLLGDPVPVHFGSYETEFLKRMRTRYHEGSEQADFVSQLITSSVNVLGPLHAQVAKRGERFWVASSSPGLSARVSFYGLYLYNEGQVRLWPFRRANGDHTIAVLQRLRAAFPDEALIVLWDGAPYHRAKAVQEAATTLNITLMPLGVQPGSDAGRGALALAARGRHVPSLPYQRRGPDPAGGRLRDAREPRPVCARRPPLGQGSARPRGGETALLKVDGV